MNVTSEHLALAQEKIVCSTVNTLSVFAGADNLSGTTSQRLESRGDCRRITVAFWLPPSLAQLVYLHFSEKIT